jgi:hypothetical protein
MGYEGAGGREWLQEGGRHVLVQGVGESGYFAEIRIPPVNPVAFSL